jgi:hypothetical protein
MNLFPYEPTLNLLPFDGIANFWQHSLPKTAKIAKPRINLTFRTIVLGESRRVSRGVSR